MLDNIWWRNHITRAYALLLSAYPFFPAGIRTTQARHVKDGRPTRIFMGVGFQGPHHQARLASVRGL